MTTKPTNVLALCGLLGALTSGCAQTPLCPALGDCGGPDPIGSWVLAPGYPSCTEDLFVPPTDKRLTRATMPAAGHPAPEPAVYDWCDLLIASGGPMVQLRQPAFLYESGQIGVAEVRINAPDGSAGTDGTYTTNITRTGTFVLDFPEICVRQFGATDGKPIDPTNPMSPVGNVCKQLEPPIAASGLGEGSYRNTRCEPNPTDPGGCVCQFDVTETGGPSGFWKRYDQNTLLFIPQTNFPGKVTFCNKGTSLELTGADGDYLFGQRGLRTFRLKQVVVAP
jgi:hypothetical protein